jgi:phage terminase small subunit
MQKHCTPKQETFCLAFMETGNASEAYRRAYDCQAMKPATIKRKAAELMSNGTITATLAYLRAPAVKAAQMTLEAHLADLKVLRDKAAETGQFSAAISAEIARGKAAGVAIEKTEPLLTAVIHRIELVSLEQ